MPRSSRLAIWCLALLLSLSLCIKFYMKGRAPTAKGEGAAFLRQAPGMVKVRLAGDFPHPGIYLFPDGATLASAIKMTVSGSGVTNPGGLPTATPLHPGDVVVLKADGPDSAVLSLEKMPVKERMLLAIPLDPDLLTEDEWAALPGIGPALSARIVAHRQKYGAFRSLDALLRVPGIGPTRLAAIRRYF